MNLMLPFQSCWMTKLLYLYFYISISLIVTGLIRTPSDERCRFFCNFRLNECYKRLEDVHIQRSCTTLVPSRWLMPVFAAFFPSPTSSSPPLWPSGLSAPEWQQKVSVDSPSADSWHHTCRQSSKICRLCGRLSGDKISSSVCAVCVSRKSSQVPF